MATTLKFVLFFLGWAFVTGSLIAPVIMHAVWNIVGAIILGGVSLADDYPHMLNTTFSGSMLLSGGACKIEGSVIVLIWNILLILYFFFRRSLISG